MVEGKYNIPEDLCSSSMLMYEHQMFYDDWNLKNELINIKHVDEEIVVKPFIEDLRQSLSMVKDVIGEINYNKYIYNHVIIGAGSISPNIYNLSVGGVSCVIDYLSLENQEIIMVPDCTYDPNVKGYRKDYTSGQKQFIIIHELSHLLVRSIFGRDYQHDRNIIFAMFENYMIRHTCVDRIQSAYNINNNLWEYDESDDYYTNDIHRGSFDNLIEFLERKIMEI